MQVTTSAVRTILTASRRYALMAGVCAITIGFAACGSDSSKETKTTGSTSGSSGTTSGSTTGSTTGTTTTGEVSPTSQDCALTHNSTFTEGDASGLSLTPAAGGTATPMVSVLFIYNPNATDPNKAYAVSVFDYDYCDFSTDHGYSAWPTTGFHAASFFLVDAANQGGTFTTGKYTVEAGTQSIYQSTSSTSYGSGVTETGAGGGGSSCLSQVYPTLTTGNVDITSTPAAGKNAIPGVTGSINITLSDKSVLSGTFTSGTCTAATVATPASPDLCACSLGTTK